MKFLIVELDDDTDIDSVVSRLQELQPIGEASGANAKLLHSVADEPRERSVHPNKKLVEALKWRVRLHGTDILNRDVINVAGVDDSEFYKWQRGYCVGRRTRQRCDATVRLDPDEFLKRLNAPPR